MLSARNQEVISVLCKIPGFITKEEQVEELVVAGKIDFSTATDILDQIKEEGVRVEDENKVENDETGVAVVISTTEDVNSTNFKAGTEPWSVLKNPALKLPTADSVYAANIVLSLSNKSTQEKINSLLEQINDEFSKAGQQMWNDLLVAKHSIVDGDVVTEKDSAGLTKAMDAIKNGQFLYGKQ
jgi:hypothetical protein